MYINWLTPNVFIGYAANNVIPHLIEYGHASVCQHINEYVDVGSQILAFSCFESIAGSSTSKAITRQFLFHHDCMFVTNA